MIAPACEGEMVVVRANQLLVAVDGDGVAEVEMTVDGDGVDEVKMIVVGGAKDAEVVGVPLGVAVELTPGRAAIANASC